MSSLLQVERLKVPGSGLSEERRREKWGFGPRSHGRSSKKSAMIKLVGRYSSSLS